MRDRAARIRTGTEPAFAEAAASDPRVQISLSGLHALEGPGKALSLLPRQPAQSVLNGRHASRLRGRGLNFEELRGYLPSDDVRSIDWKVTARTGTPHVRVFTEERDRPTLIVVDQRMTMFFGSVFNMKSVTAAECAALAAHCVLDQGDRVGGIVFGDRHIAEIRPKRSRAALEQFLTALVDANHLLRADAPNVDPMPLNRVLQAVSRIAKRNHLVIVFSDFDEIDATTRQLVSGLSRHNDLVLCPVTDPFSGEVPDGARLVVSDGALQAEIDTDDRTVQQNLVEFATGRLAEVLEWQRTLGLAVVPLTAAEDSVHQLRRLLGVGRQ